MDENSQQNSNGLPRALSPIVNSKYVLVAPLQKLQKFGHCQTNVWLYGVLDSLCSSFIFMLQIVKKISARRGHPSTIGYWRGCTRILVRGLVQGYSRISVFVMLYVLLSGRSTNWSLEG